jgi:TP901 family phage tail tape measure protein
MANKNKIGASIVLEGEKEFKAAVTDCNRQLRGMKSELSLVKEKYAENANSLEALQAKHKVLSQVLQGQRSKLDATKVGYVHSAESQKKVADGLEKLRAEYKNAQAEMAEMKKSGTATDAELDKQQKTIDELAEAIKKGERNYEAAGNRVQDWNKKLNTAEAETIRASRALNTNDKYMKEAKNSANGCATSIDQYGKSVREVRVNVEQLGESNRQAFNNLADQIVASGVKEKVEDIAKTLYECSESAEKFESASAKVSTIADTSKKSMGTLNKEMLDLSTKTGTAVTDITESTYQAISASVDTSKAVETVGEATKLAKGGFTDSTTAIDGLTTVLNSYGNKVKDASEVSDVFLTVQNLGKTSVNELASSIGKVATNAANYGVSLQDLGTAYIQLTKRGIETSESTTYIKSLMKELSKQGSKTAATLQTETGKSFTELMAEGKSLGDVIQILSDSVGGDATAFSNLFSRQEAATAATVLLKTGTEDYNNTLKKVTNSTGAANDAYKKMTDTSETAKQKMLNGIENLKIAIGTQLNESLDGMYQHGQKAISWAMEFIKKNPDVVKAVVSLTASLATLTTIFSGFTIIKTIIPLLESFKLALMTHPVGLAATALATLVAGLVVAEAQVKRTATETEKAAQADQKYIKELKEKNKVLHENIEQTQSSFETVKNETTTVDQLVDRLKKLNSVQNKTAAQKAEIKRISEQLKDKIPQIAAAYDDETGAIKLTNNQMDRLVKNYKRTALAAAAQSQLTEAAKEALEAQERLNDAKVKAEECDNKNTKAQEKYNKALKKAQELSKSEGAVGATGAVSNEMIKAQDAVTKAARDLKATNKSYEDAKKTVKAYENDLNKANEMMDTANNFIKKYSASAKKQRTDTDNSANAAKKAARQYKNLGKAFDTAVVQMGKSGSKVDNATKRAFSNSVNIAKKTGTKIPKGLAAGLKDGSKSPQTALDTLNTAINKKLMILATNARKQGAYIPEEITKGINGSSADPTVAYEAISKQIQKRADSMQKKLDKVGINISAGMKKSFEKGGQSSLDVIQKSDAKISKLMKAAGVNSVDGLLAGVEKKKPEVVKAYEDLGDAADKAFKKKLDIHSPSRVFKKSGEYTVDGLIQGIESSSKNVGKSAEQLGNILVKELSDKIKNKDLKTNGKGYSNATIAKWWKAVVNATYAGTTAHTKALQKYYAARNKVTNDGEKQRKSLEKQRAAYQKKLEKEQKERQKKLEAQKKATAEKQQALVTKLQNKIEMRDLKTNGHGYNEKTVKTYWDKVVKATKKGTSAHTDALKQYYEARNNLINSKKEYLSNYKKSYKEYMSTLKSELEELKKTYNESVKSTKESIASSLSIFSDVSLTKTDDENGLVVNLQRQVDALQKWRTNLQVLRDRGASDEMMKEIEGLGVNSAGDVETLTKMNNEQWAEYKQLYSQKNAVAKMEAVTQNKDLKKSTDKKMKELEKTYKTKIAKLKKTYQKEMKSIGANVAKGFANGIEKGSNDVYKAIAKLTGQTVKQVKKNLGIHSPSRVMAELGAYTGLGFAQGLQRETQGLADIITGNLPTTVPQVNGKATSGLQKSSQLNLTIQMDGNVVGKAALNTVDMLQGAKVSLTRRGIANA